MVSVDRCIPANEPTIFYVVVYQPDLLFLFYSRSRFLPDPKTGRKQLHSVYSICIAVGFKFSWV